MKSIIFIVTLSISVLLASCGSLPGAGPTSPPSPAGAGDWTWVNGANVADQNGTYGTQQSAASGNIPGARAQGATWIDAAGSFWLFGGGYDTSPLGAGFFNDLWKYGAGQWTWMGGPNDIHQNGTYGTQGTAAPGNTPGARYYSVIWTEAAGNFWLFGGNGFDSGGTLGVLNDMWKYKP